MADEVLNLQIVVNAETGQLEVVSKGLSSVGNEAKKAQETFSGLSKGAADTLKALGLIASVGAVAKFFSDSVKTAEAFNESLRKIEFNLKALGKESDLSREELIKWGKSIQDNTRFADDQALSAFNKFIRVTGDVAQSQSASRLAMDLSVASGKDLAETIELVSNLMLGQQRAVLQAQREFGAFVGTGKDTQTVLDNLQKSLSGAAEKEDSFTKKTSQLRNEWDDFSKNVGNVLIPALSFLITVAGRIFEAFERLGIGIAGIFARMVVNAEIGFKSIAALAKGNFEEYGRLEAERTQRMYEINQNEKESSEKLGKDKVEIAKNTTALISKVSEDELREREKKLQEAKEKEEKEIDERLKNYIDAEKKKQKIFLEIQEDEKKGIKEIADFEKKQSKETAEAEEKINAEKKIVIHDVAQFTSQEFSKAFADVIMESKNLDEAFTQMGQNIIRMIIQMVTQMAIFKAIMSASTFTPTSIGGGGGIGLFGLGGFFAEGGKVEAGKSYVVGEQGAELLKMGSSGGEVISNRELTELKPSRRMVDDGSLDSGSTVNVYVNLSTDKLSIDNGKAIIQALAREIADKTADAVKLSVQMKNLGQRNLQKAV